MGLAHAVPVPPGSIRALERFGNEKKGQTDELEEGIPRSACGFRNDQHVKRWRWGKHSARNSARLLCGLRGTRCLSEVASLAERTARGYINGLVSLFVLRLFLTGIVFYCCYYFHVQAMHTYSLLLNICVYIGLYIGKSVPTF